MERIKARAVVDIEKHPEGGRLGNFRVECWGEEPHDFVRIYTISAMSDTMAAQEGLRRFVDDIGALLSAKEG
jgi:hypothetical protein